MKFGTSGIRHDYKNRSTTVASRRARRVMLFATGLLLPSLALSLFLAGKSPAPPPRVDHVAFVGPVLDAPIDDADSEKPDALEAASLPSPVLEPAIGLTGAILELLVQPGDTLERLFRRNGLSLQDLADLVAMPEVGSALKYIRPGDRLEISHRDSEVLSLKRELDEVRVLSIHRGESGFEANTLERKVDVRTTAAHGVIKSSLFEAGIDAGMSDKITMDMAGIFEWDIDFIQDVREGDEFTVIYEELWRDGVKLKNGDIVAAEFVNQGKTYRAARYRSPSGRTDYFTPEGRSLRKAFIRAPLNFTRISSNFNLSRKHPILNKIRAHRGVDYAAPIGTPVRAAGDGKVVFRGVQGGYGNVVILQHGGNVTTLYGHLSRFAKARNGSRVRQGDVIGYVGQSGLATGPHLHYEYRVNGVHRNPRTVPLPPADPIPADQEEDFRRVTASLWRRLDAYDGRSAAVASQ